MKLKTSITIIAGCFGIFLFIMLPIILSVEDKKEDYTSSIKGSDFSLNDVNKKLITEKSFQGPATALFFGFTHCPDVCPMTLNKLSIILERLKKENKSLKVLPGWRVSIIACSFSQGFSASVLKSFLIKLDINYINININIKLWN